VQPFKILVVDDFEDFRELVCLMLEERAEFHVVGQASDGLEAVRRAEELKPDLILLDIGLPTLNGLEAGRRIRGLSSNSKILFFSLESSPEVIREALLMGGHGYLHKTDGGELLVAMDAVLQGKQFVSSHVKHYAIADTRYENVADFLQPRAHAWRVSGTYLEACNCEAICPCRVQGGMRISERSTYGFCDFALSWRIVNGMFADVDLSDRFVVMAGSYRDYEPNKPWRVILYVDDRSSDKQFAALSDIFLGRAGGTTFQNFGVRIGATYAVRRAKIELDHRPRRWFMRASKWVEVRASRTAPSEHAVSYGIPGNDRSGNELIADVFRVNDDPLNFHVRGRCGFETIFEYSSQA
jgi:DNA-binding NarL/FixJ family response regulator